MSRSIARGRRGITPPGRRAKQRDGQRRLEADDAKRGAVELELLDGRRVRRVVRGDRVDRAIGKAASERLRVGVRTEGRVHLGRRVVCSACLVGEREVMGRDLAGHGQAASFGVTHHRDGARGRCVGDVVARAGHLDEDEVARHDDLFCFGRLAGNARARRHRALVHGAALRKVVVLGVLHDGQVDTDAPVLEGAPHQPSVHHASTVVG